MSLPFGARWAIRRALPRLRRLRPDMDLSRVDAYAESIVTGDTKRTAQHPKMGYFPGLRAKPYWEADDSPLTAEVAHLLRSKADAVRREYLSVSKDTKPPRYGPSDQYPSLLGDAWAGLLLWTVRHGFTQESARFPETRALIRRMEHNLVGEAVFLVLRPGTVLPPHTDVTNAQLTCHLGLLVPPGCALVVNGMERSWIEGDVLFFDHSYLHTAWNRGTESRVVLLLNLRHPDMTLDESNALKALVDMVVRTLKPFVPLIIAHNFFSRAMRRFKDSVADEAGG